MCTGCSAALSRTVTVKVISEVNHRSTPVGNCVRVGLALPIVWSINRDACLYEDREFLEARVGHFPLLMSSSNPSSTADMLYVNMFGTL